MDVPTQSRDRAKPKGGWITASIMFLAAAFGTYALAMTLMINNVTGLKGEPINNNPFHRENQTLAGLIIVGAMAVVAILPTLARRRLGVPRSFIAGIWFALASAAAMLIFAK